jgi:Transcription factor WhiB
MATTIGAAGLTAAEARADDLPERLWIEPVIAQADDFDPDWEAGDLACADMKPAYWTGQARDLVIGQRICGVCPVQPHCARAALDSGIRETAAQPGGLLGGLTYDQRAWLRRGGRWRHMLRRKAAGEPAPKQPSVRDTRGRFTRAEQLALPLETAA